MWYTWGTILQRLLACLNLVLQTEVLFLILLVQTKEVLRSYPHTFVIEGGRTHPKINWKGGNVFYAQWEGVEKRMGGDLMLYGRGLLLGIFQKVFRIFYRELSLLILNIQCKYTWVAMRRPIITFIKLICHLLKTCHISQTALLVRKCLISQQDIKASTFIACFVKVLIFRSCSRSQILVLVIFRIILLPFLKLSGKSEFWGFTCVRYEYNKNLTDLKSI